MKKILMVFAIALFMASCGTTYTTTTTSENQAYDIPEALRTNFTVSYPSATNVTWQRYDAATTPIDWELTDWPALGPNDYVVQFNLGNERYNAWYNTNGEWIGSAYAVTDHSVLPSAVHDLLRNQFAGYTIEKVEREFWKDKQAYELKLRSTSNADEKVKLLVDANGTILKQKLKD
jgi:hypothetical protein